MADFITGDRTLFLWLNNLGSPRFDQFWIMISEVWVWVPFYFILCYLLFRNFSLRNLIYILIFIALGVTVSDQTAGIFKSGIMRLRPCHDVVLQPLMRSVKCGGPYGFYSSHASNVFFLATFISSLLGKKFPLLVAVLFIWAAVVSYSRIYLGVHFPLDVTFGAIVGFLLGGLFSAMARRTLK